LKKKNPLSAWTIRDSALGVKDEAAQELPPLGGLSSHGDTTLFLSKKIRFRPVSGASMKDLAEPKARLSLLLHPRKSKITHQHRLAAR